MAYDLSAFNTTFYNRAGENNQTILNKWPYLCSREALVKALEGTNYVGSANPRNPNGYTAAQMADKIIELFDEIMYDTWNNSSVYHPKSLEGSINAGLRWDQTDFWASYNVHFIFHDGDGAGLGYYVLDNVANENIVIWPQTAYGYNPTEFKRKPFLGFDNLMMTSQFAAELDLVNAGTDNRIDGINGGYGLTNGLISAGSFVIGEEYNIREVGTTDFTLIGASDNNINTVFTATGAGTGTGKARETDGIITSDGDNPIPVADIHKSLMYVYNSDFYHPTLQPNGFRATYWDGSVPSNWTDGSFPSDRRYDLSLAKFEVTVSGGVVTAITAVSMNDGDGNPVVGGWGYSDSNDYQELTFQGGIQYSSATQLAPRVLIRANADQSGYSGNKATVNIADSTSEFFAGKDLTDGTYNAYAVYGSGGLGYSNPNNDPGTSFNNWYDINLPTSVLPSGVRVMIERPVLSSTTRSLKQKRVGTGAHRYGFEFEYPPMTQEQADDFINFFDNAKGGAKECQIYIPKTVMPHLEGLFYNEPVSVASNNLSIDYGKTVGSDVLRLSGLEPYYNAGYNMTGRHFTHDNKIYRITAAETVDEYGRTAIRIEPPLISAGSNSIRARTTNYDRGNFFLVKAFLMDDTLDYQVDAAGLYKIRFKFVETLG